MLQTADGEKHLKALLDYDTRSIVRELKGRGVKIIGIACSYVPEESILGSGMFPWRVSGTQTLPVSRASLYRSPDISLSYTHLLEAILLGELDFLDGIILTDRDDDMRRLYDVVYDLKKFNLTYMMHVPYANHAICVDEFARSLKRLIETLEDFAEAKIDTMKLGHTIQTCNESRRLLRRVYELRKREWTPLNGTEVMKLVRLSMHMPKNDFNGRLESLLPYLEARRAPLKSNRPRLLVSSDELDDLKYFEMIESEGAAIVMDDLDHGSRYLWEDVNPDEEPFRALAKRFLTLPDYARQSTWKRQVERVINWVKEFRVDGVIQLLEPRSLPRAFRSPYLEMRLKKEGIPAVTFTRQYPLGFVEQLRTRVGAFVEMLSASSNNPEVGNGFNDKGRRHRFGEGNS